MYSIKELYQLINQAIAEYNYPKQPQELYEPITYFMDLGGKRIRPILVLMACNLFSDDIQKAIQPALGVELFHNFTLIHDDIMDHAPTRRGKPTVHEKWSSTTAILSGDVMLIEAYKRIIQVRSSILPDILRVFNDTAVGVCEGQQMDMGFEKATAVQIDDYLHMIRLKTAILLGGALKIGAMIGGSSPEDANLLYSFGEKMGIAFQLQDDILDVYGDPKKIGKQIGGDILSNKKTFMLIKAQELTQNETRKTLNSWLTNTKANPQEKIKEVTAIYDQLHIRQLTEQTMNQFIQSAFLALDQLRVDRNKKAALQNFAKQLLMRES